MLVSPHDRRGTVAMGEPIRVCEFVGNMNGGGVEAVVMNYYRHVDRSKVQFDFVVTDSSTIVPRSEMESLGARVYVVPAYTNLIAFQKASYELFNTHPEWKIVHAHMNALNVFPLKEAFRAGVPVRISHSHSTAGRGEMMKNIAKAVLKTQANRYPTERFACSRFAGEWLFGKEEPFELVYNAIDLDRFWFSGHTRALVRQQLGFHDGQLVIGHVGRFMPQKNQGFLIDVFEKLVELRDDVMLVFVGTGQGESAAKEAVRARGIAERVRFLGQRDDVADLYQAFDMFVLPSLYEGLGMVAVEAQVSGLPCVISDKVPAEANVTGNCRVLPLHEPRSWANVLCGLTLRDGSERASIDRRVFSNYDIIRQAAWLTEKYLRFHEGAV